MGASSGKFKVGDRVVVQNDASTVQELQKGHGGWHEDMEAILGKEGTVMQIFPDKDVMVEILGRPLCLNPLCLQTVTGSGGIGREKGPGRPGSSGSQTDMLMMLLAAAAAARAASGSRDAQSEKSTGKLAVGDSVQILNDRDTVCQLQVGHGEWVDAMMTSLGKTGKVVNIDSDGDIKVVVDGDLWTFNPKCLRPIGVRSSAKISDPDGGMALLQAAFFGNAEDVKRILEANPDMIDVQISNKSALHCAVARKNVAVVKILLEFKPNLEIMDEDGDTPLHLTVHRDEEEIVTLLLNAGANVNSKNKKGITPLMIASAKGQTKAIKQLLKCPKISLQQKDKDGDTALHISVYREKAESIALLLEAGADPDIKNDNGFSPMHEAAKRGRVSAVELFVRYVPQSINNRKEDGYTMLHLAALNDNILVVNALAASDHCYLDVCNNEQETPLHIALKARSLTIAEQLVGFGADLNAADKNGNTALHYAFELPSMGEITNDTPQLSKVRDVLKSRSKFQQDDKTTTRIALACFLIQEGANPEIKNVKGKFPLELCNADIASIILPFKGKGSFHSALRPRKNTSASTSEEVFDDIELQGKIGEGGQGAVYRAIHKKTGKLIAAKKMPIESIASGEKELAMMKSLKNKNIVELFGVAKDPDGGILILMELADDSLFGVFKKSAPEVTRSINWAAQVAEGMCYLHYGAPQPILHGDMKSLNVLSFPNGIVKISDFGCSKFHNVTHVTNAAISILWSAPELFAENQKPNFACDVYSYGILLWEMMTHKQPYEGMSVASILSNILTNNVRPDIPASCPAFVSDLMKECWDRDPKKRPTFRTIVKIFEQRLAKSSESNASPSPNQVEEINDFELKEKIGAGGTGIVLKAFWKSKNMTVAVKKVHVKSSESIMKEVAIMKSVRHKNIVHFYNVCQDADQNYLIVLELADSSLDKVVKTIEPNIKRTVNWAIQVAKGMSYLHYDAPTSIIHGDLKSMNVLTFPGDVVKISDFGSAKFFDVTRQTSVNVTFAWSAPELFKKKATPNLSCDVYSFGIVLWELLTHKEPYADCEGQQQILGAVMTGERPEIPETCPKLLSDLIVKCWDGNPQVRPNFKIVLRNLEDVEEKLC